MSTMQVMQQGMHGDHHDYEPGSPHLKHLPLRRTLSAMLEQEILRLAAERSRSVSLLDVGAGHGGFSERALALGARVTATDMSLPSLRHVERRFSCNPSFQAVFDPHGDLEVLGDRRFDLVFFSSVLHHIPDYLEFIRSRALPRLESDGTILSIQDPLWYPTRTRFDSALTNAGYVLWRTSQGNLRRGLSTQVRRARRILDESNPADMVEYHVVRNGVDHAAILQAIEPHFESVELATYWSSQSATVQKVGTALRRANTFAFVARGCRKPA